MLRFAVCESTHRENPDAWFDVLAPDAEIAAKCMARIIHECGKWHSGHRKVLVERGREKKLFVVEFELNPTFSAMEV